MLPTRRSGSRNELSRKKCSTLFDTVISGRYNSVMKNGEALWNLDELTAAVTQALSEGYEGALSGRVRDVPDRRTIRYYTTLGLIDRPAEMRGRTAIYNRRHLLQIVAIKKLQATGRRLAEVQQDLTGRTDREPARDRRPGIHRRVSRQDLPDSGFAAIRPRFLATGTGSSFTIDSGGRGDGRG